MIAPSTMIVNIAHKAAGWEPIICSHEELIELTKKIFITGQPVEYLEMVKQASRGGFWGAKTLKTTDERYELFVQAAASSKGRLVTIQDNEQKKIYEKDYLLLKKFATAVIEECDKELQHPAEKSDVVCVAGEIQSGKESNTQVCLFCPQCGTKVATDDVFCGECGTSLRS